MVENNNTNKTRFRKFTHLELVDLDVNDDDFDGDAEIRGGRKRSSGSSAKNVYDMSSYVTEEENGVFTRKRVFEDDMSKVESEAQKLAQPRSKIQVFYTIIDLRDGSAIDRVTPDNKCIFFAACKKDEKKNFLAIKRTFKHKEGEKRYSLKNLKTGRHIEDLSQEELQKFVDKVSPSKMAEYEVVQLKDEVFLDARLVPEKKKRVSGEVKSHRKELPLGDCIEDKCDDLTRALTASLDLMPELDTVRVYFPCANLIDINAFIPYSANKTVYLCDRGVDGSIGKEKTLFRAEFQCSWYGKMQITREKRKYGKNGAQSFDVLSFEYSVAKWYNFTNGINCGVEADAEYMLYPCIQAMKAYNIETFAWSDKTTFELIAKEFLETAEIRRFDLSMNFRTNNAMYKARDYINLVARCRLNRQGSKCEDKENPIKGSISWGTEKSPYRVIMYDKETEQRRYFAMKDGRRPLHWWEDEKGNRYERQNEQGTLKNVEFDFDRERKKFYNANKDKFERVYRYEVQFRTKFMQENHLMTTGVENINNVLRMGEVYWRDILNRFDEQLGRTNFENTKEREGLAKALDKLSSLKESEVISRTVYSNMFTFITECMYRTWEVVRDELGKDLFSNKYRTCKKLLNYDVKIECPRTEDGQPIMRIMPTLLLNHEQQLMQSFRFVPAPVYKIAMGG